MLFLVENSHPALPATHIAAILDQLIWCMSDNGEELLRVRDTWLLGANRRQVEIALAMDEVLPFASDERAQNLAIIEERWPDLAPRCRAIALLSK